MDIYGHKLIYIYIWIYMDITMLESSNANTAIYCHFNGEPWIFDLTGVGFSHILRQNQRNIKSSLDGRFSKQHGDFPMKWGLS